MKKIVFVLMIIPIVSCLSKAGKRTNCDFFDQYSLLLRKSYEYDFANPHFRKAVSQFVDTTTVYDFKASTKFPVLVLQPFLFNSTQNKVVIMVLSRKTDQKNEQVDYVHFVEGELKLNTWNFVVRKGITRSFSYVDQQMLSDQEIAMRTLRTLMDWGYMKSGSCKVEDAFFDSWSK